MKKKARGGVKKERKKGREAMTGRENLYKRWFSVLNYFENLSSTINR